MLLGFKNLDIPSPTVVKTLVPEKFEIRVVKFEFPNESLHLVAAYRSPSMSTIAEIDEYFTFLQLTIAGLTGKIILVGDLNVSKDRKFCAGATQEILLDRIVDAGLYSKFTGVTRPASVVQLDYIYANYRVKSTYCEGFKSDHCALSAQFCFETIITIVPMKIVFLNNISEKCLQKLLNDFVELLLVDKNISNAELLIELELFIHDLQEIYDYKVFHKHNRILGKSRQVSCHIFSRHDWVDQKAYNSKLESLQKLDAARRLKKFMTSKNLGKAINSIFCMPSKRDTQKYHLSAKLFAEKIINNEKGCCHSNHGFHDKRLDLLKDKSLINLDNLKHKFNQYYNRNFWERIKDNLFTQLDTNINYYSQVDVVVKDKAKLSELSGWRLIWKTAPIPKFYDLIKSECIDNKFIENHAYKKIVRLK